MRCRNALRHARRTAVSEAPPESSSAPAGNGFPTSNGDRMGPNGIWGTRTSAGPLPWADILPHPPGEAVASPANPGSYPRPPPGVMPQRSSQAGRVGRQWRGSRWGAPSAMPESAEAAEAASAAVRAATAAAAAAPPQPALTATNAVPRAAQVVDGLALGAPTSRSERGARQPRADSADGAAGPGPGSQRGPAAGSAPPRGQPRARGPRGGQRAPRVQRTLNPGRPAPPEEVPLDWDAPAPAKASGRRLFQSGPRREAGGAEGWEQGGEGVSERARGALDARGAEPALLRRGLGSTADFFTQVRTS